MLHDCPVPVGRELDPGGCGVTDAAAFDVADDGEVMTADACWERLDDASTGRVVSVVQEIQHEPVEVVGAFQWQHV